MRVVAAALLPAFAVTLYLTFSRGAIWVLPVGLVLYVLAGAAARAAHRAAPARGSRRRRDEDRLRQRIAGARGLRLSAAAAARAGTWRWSCSSAALVAAGLRYAALPLDKRIERIELPRERALAARGGRARRPARRRRAGQRAAADLRRPRDVHPGPVHGLLERPAHAADLGGRQRADRQLARRARRLRRPARSTGPAPGPTGSPGTATGRRRRSRSTTATRCTWRRCPSWAWSGWCCC